MEVLKEIGSALGPVLRIDSYTATGSRGSYTRLCIQIEIDKPLITSICIGRMVQQVKYEGISSLCFCCGRLGHKQENCGYQIKQQQRPESIPAENEGLKKAVENSSKTNYGPWMLVTRRKNLVRNRQVKGNIKEGQESDVSLKGKKVHQQVNKEGLETEVIGKSAKADMLSIKLGPAHVRDELSNQAAVKDPDFMATRHDVLGSNMEVIQNMSEGKRGNFTSVSKAAGKRVLGVKMSKSLKRQHSSASLNSPTLNVVQIGEDGRKLAGKKHYAST